MSFGITALSRASGARNELIANSSRADESATFGSEFAIHCLPEARKIASVATVVVVNCSGSAYRCVETVRLSESSER
jgi:hypothetical protein